jgi:DNA-binding NarL/FixJ family response regulator
LRALRLTAGGRFQQAARGCGRRCLRDRLVGGAALEASSFAVLQSVVAAQPELPVIVVSSNDHPRTARRAQLTPQQLRVLMAMADGLLNKQIAHELGLAENTMKVHVTAILRKLGCYSRTQAAVMLKALEAQRSAEHQPLE